MTNTNRHSWLSWKGALPGGGARLRVYTLGTGGNAETYFSLKLWYAAAQRQERLARLAPAPKTA
ncbi:MAG: hypothetical protein NDI60_11875 [Elusimicrobiales bacterium]|nr:hypothetical protein [Elusimicrobiales bacterium]